MDDWPKIMIVFTFLRTPQRSSVCMALSRGIIRIWQQTGNCKYAKEFPDLSQEGGPSLEIISMTHHGSWSKYAVRERTVMPV